MKINEYVRTKCGIAKYCGLGKDILKETPNYNTHHHYDNQHIFDKSIFDVNHDYGDTLTNDEFININKNYKHSKDIIDLIEVGDYVNGSLVCNVGKGNKYIYLVDFPDLINIKANDEIRTILTKQQFESNAYTIEKES